MTLFRNNVAAIEQIETDTVNNTHVDESDQIHATTAYTANDQAKVSEPDGMKVSDIAIMRNQDYGNLPIHTLLSQPVPVIYGTFSAGSNTSASYLSHDTLLSNSSFHRNKVQGYLGIRATVVFRLVVNADKYTQGRYIVAYSPRTTNSTYRTDFRLLTQLPHVELDLNTDTEVVLRIPHRGPYTHFDITNRRHNPGEFIIHNYLPHRGNEVPYTIYMAFEDVDLIGPTATTTVAYEGVFMSIIPGVATLVRATGECFRPKCSGDSDNPHTTYDVHHIHNSHVTTHYNSGDVNYEGFLDIFFECFKPGRPKHGDTIYEGRLEVEEKTKVPLSQKVKDLSSAMLDASGIPLIGSYIEPVAWVTALAGNVLSIFGWSKPLTTETPSVFVQRGLAKLNHSDGTDYAEQLAMTTTTGVGVSDEIGLTDHDEMALAHILGVRSAMFRFSYDTTDLAGTKLLSFPLDPFAMKAASGFGPSAPGGYDEAMIMHPMAYMANVFSLYRGSIEVTIEISKTIFHSGRLMMVFEPIQPDVISGNIVPASRVITLADTINCHKDIIDIRSGNAFSFLFPFTSLTPYLMTGQPYGYVHIFIVNNLVRNETAVSSLVDVGVKVRAHKDMEFAGTADPRYWPSRFNGSEENAALSSTATLVYESGLEVETTELVSKPVGSAVAPQETHVLAEKCIGEKIMSVKQVAMRSKIVSIGLQSPSQFNPFVVDSNYSTTIGAAGFEQWHDYYSYIAGMYAYARGGVVLSVHNPEADAIQVSIHNEFNTAGESTSFRRRYAEFSLTSMIPSKGFDRLYIPPYDQSYVRWVRGTPGAFGNTGSAVDGFSYAGYSKVKVLMTGTGDGDYTAATVYRAAAEDTQFGVFVGIPFMSPRAPWVTLFNLGADLKSKGSGKSFEFPAT